MADIKKQLLKELDAEHSSSDEEGSSEEEEEEFEDYDDLVVHEDAEEEDNKPSTAPVWATINFGSPSRGGGLPSLAGIEGKRRSTLTDISASTLSKERQKMESEKGDGGEQPKLRSWVSRRTALNPPLPNNQKSDNETKADTTTTNGSAEQPKLRSWATRRSAAEVFSLPKDGEQKSEQKEETPAEDKQSNEEAKAESSSAAGGQPKMRSWVSRKQGNAGYSSLNQLAEKYASLKEKSEKAKQDAIEQGLPPPESAPKADSVEEQKDKESKEKKDSPVPGKRRASAPSVSSPLANSSKKGGAGSPEKKKGGSPSASPDKKKGGGSPNNKLSSLDPPQRRRTNSTPAALGDGRKFSNSIHGSLSRASQKLVHEELLRQQEKSQQKKREKRAKYRAKQKIKKHETEEEKKKQQEVKQEEQVIEEEENRLVKLEKVLREMVEELNRVREQKQKEKEAETKNEEGKKWEEEANKVLDNLGGALFSNVSAWTDERLYTSLTALKSFWEACKKIHKESDGLLKLDLSCFIFVTVKPEEEKEKDNNSVLQKNVKDAISKKFNFGGEEGGEGESVIGVSSVSVEELETAKKFWASFDNYWDGKDLIAKLKEEKKLKGLAPTEELDKKLKVLRTLVGMLLWDYSLSLLRDAKFVTAKFSGIEGMGDTTFFLGRPHANSKDKQSDNNEEHWVGILWGKK